MTGARQHKHRYRLPARVVLPPAQLTRLDRLLDDVAEAATEDEAIAASAAARDGGDTNRQIRSAWNRRRIAVMYRTPV